MENPLLSDDIFLSSYVGRDDTRPLKEKPEHYKVISISLYTEDIALLDQLVKEAKQLGHTKANKSQIIRCALHNLDLRKLPKTY
jgi:hypothetical protein